MIMIKEPKDNRTRSSSKRFGEILGVLGRYNLINGLSPEKLRMIFEDLGPTFVKFGQILSMRSDMIPETYCKELSRLRTEVRPIDFSDVVSVLESEYGADYREVFGSLEESPIGSASIAQVHAAVLKNGRDVVVKVQRPGIYERMSQDIRLLHKASAVIKIFGRAGQVIDINSVLDEIWAVTKQEMNFMTEAEHISRFAQLGADIRYVAFPEVIRELTTPRVLCMERVGGIQIDDADELKRQGYDLKDIAQKLIAGYAKQVIEDGFFHADPHPGNLRIRDGKIVWLDLGMIGTLSPRDRSLIKKAMTAIVCNDIYELKQAVLDISRHTGKIDHSSLSEDVEEMLHKYGAAELGSLNVGEMFNDLLEIAESNCLSLPSGISMLGRGMLTLEGVVSKIDPETNVVHIFSTILSSASFEDVDLKKELEKKIRLLWSMDSRTAEVSGYLTEIVRQTAKGQNKLNIEIVGSNGPLLKISHMVNRLIVCIIIAAGLIGSSLLCQTDMQPKLLGIPLLGVFGYILSLGLGIWLLVDIIIKKKL